MFLKHQISILELFPKDHVTLKTGGIDQIIFDQINTASVSKREFKNSVFLWEWEWRVTKQVKKKLTSLGYIVNLEK